MNFHNMQNKENNESSNTLMTVHKPKIVGITNLNLDLKRKEKYEEIGISYRSRPPK